MNMNHQPEATHGMHAMQANGLLAPGNATHTAIRSGDWTDPGTWSGGRVPGAEARVHVPEDVSVTYDARSDVPLEIVRVDGTLSWAQTQDTKMVVETIVTTQGSHLEIGTADNPVRPGSDAEIVFRDTALNTAVDPGQLGHGLVAFGEVDIHGASKESFLTMDGVSAGATEVAVSGDTTNWTVGDTLLFVGTTYEGLTSWEEQVLKTQDEERVITAINGDTITFDRALAHDHTPPDGYSELDTYVANLSRNVLFVSENANGTRGHVMMHNGESGGADDPANLVAYAEFRDLGRTDFTRDNDDGNPLGRYSIHLHQTGAGAGKPGSEIIGNSVNGGKGWGITQHESNAIISDNVVYDLVGAGIVSETGNEQGVWANNLVTKVVGFTARGKAQQDGLGYENNSRVIEQHDNIAANVKVGWNYIGREIFEFPTSSGDGIHRKMLERNEVQFDPSPFDVALDHQEPALTSFKGNTVLASETGMRIFHRAFSEDSDLQSVIEDYTAWGMAGTAFDMMNYSSNYLVKDSLLIGNENAKTAFMTGVKTSSGILNNVEVANYGAVYGVQGLAHEGVMIDVTTNNVNSLVSASRKSGLGSEYLKPKIIDSTGITPVDHVTFTPDANADLTVTPDDLRLRISGTTLDSIGIRVFNEYFETPNHKQVSGLSVKLDGGNKKYHSEFTMDEFLDLHGAVQRADGTWYSPVVNWITDRLTAEHHPVVIEIELREFDESLLKKYEVSDFVPPKIGNPDYDIGFGSGAGSADHDDGSHGGSAAGGDENANGDGQTGGGSDGEAGGDGDGNTNGDGDTGGDGSAGGDSNSGGVGNTSGVDTDGSGNANNNGVTGDNNVSPPVPQNAITGTPGNDWLTGTSGDNLILGGAGRDRLRGEGGDDTLEGGAGQDNMGGGAGADTFVWGPDSLAGGRDRVEDFAPGEGDVLDLSAISAAYGWDAATAAAAVSVKGSYLGVIISVDVPGTGQVALTELRGMTPEQISVAAGTLRLVAGEAPAGEAPTGGDTGNPDPVEGGGAAGGEPTGDTSTEPDTDAMNGTDLNETLRGTQDVDRIFGHAGRDVIRGEGGDDWLVGGEGADTLYGGSGADSFVFLSDDIGTGRDDIKDFSISGGDMLDLSDVLPDDALDAPEDYVRLTSSGSSTRLWVDADGGGDSFTEIALLRKSDGLTLDDLVEAEAIMF